MLFLFSGHFTQTSELVSARQRGEMVLAILEGPVLHCGLGMPSDPDAFEKAFGGHSIAFWRQALRVLDRGTGGDRAEKGELQLVYAFPLRGSVDGARILADGDVSFDAASGRVTVPLTASIPSGTFELSASQIKGWALFPTAGLPFRVRGYSAAKGLTLEPQTGSGTIARYDELHALRALKAYLIDGTFFVDDVSAGGAQPQVDNIAALHFDFDAATGFLFVTVVAAGERADERPLYDSPSDLPGWPDLSLPDFSTKWRYRRLVVVQRGWRLRN
ncbi:hypothetical protein KAR29_07575 [Aminithiophilus ramosus]|uniref:Uncharacterized protein n=2 Tax=Synergistales TaxID=649776 RepID=A0A9Q7A4K4_9BACT|nr:hypothetical protein [Aminithiophilus ramosus]QTX31260.1 hypothetical protein KAR29_07575 [Aminithiophilus ramosus]QVL35060.1 hypothetical protein KIH16_07420 [Synergistota bacterium]